MAAFVGALLVQASDRTPLTIAALADRFERRGEVITALSIVLVAGNVLATVGAAFVAPLLTPNAKALFLAFALLSAGGTALLPPRMPMVVKQGAAGAFFTTLGAMLAVGLGDRTQFLTAALALRAPVPAFAAIGAVLGALAVNVAAASLRARVLTRLPVRLVRLLIALLLLGAGAVAGLSALRLL